MISSCSSRILQIKTVSQTVTQNTNANIYNQHIHQATTTSINNADKLLHRTQTFHLPAAVGQQYKDHQAGTQDKLM